MEYSSFEKVPHTARTYSFWDQTAFWFSTTSLPATWLYGAYMAGWKGVMYSLLLIIGVNALSLLPWAYLGQISQKTGGSMMAIARPAFGIRGSIVPSLFYLAFALGWALVNAFLGSIAISFILNQWLGWPSYFSPNNTWYMVSYLAIFAILNAIFSIAGHRWIKKLQWIATIFFLILGGYQTFLVLQKWGIQNAFAWKPATNLAYATGFGSLQFVFPITFALLFDLMVSFNWTWEFIGDFSRFAKTKSAGTWAPFIGAAIAQIWWFGVGALAVAYLALTTGKYTPLLADPSSTTVSLGLGWLATLVILFATVTTDAGNIYASALSISNMLPNTKMPLRKLLVLTSAVIFPLSILPLLSNNLLSFFIFFLDFLGALVVPLWTLMLVDYFVVKKSDYSDDMFNKTGGKYWYAKGWNWKAIVTLFAGTGVYWIFAYALPNHLRNITTATIPTILFVIVVYLLLNRKK